MEEEQHEWNQSSLPSDVVFHILGSLQAEDLCSLGCCSKYFHQLSTSDCLWISLYKDRWPSITMPTTTSIKGWRNFYMERHNEMADKARSIIKVVHQLSTSQSLEVGDYQKVIADLHAMELGFKDVVMFLFASRQNTLLNLVGLHYLIFWLGVPVNCVIEALGSSKISERQVCVKWWKLGRWVYGYRLRDEARSRKVSLADLTLAKEEEVLGVLQRGAILGVIRVQILVPDTTCVSWTYRYAASQS